MSARKLSRSLLVALVVVVGFSMRSPAGAATAPGCVAPAFSGQNFANPLLVNNGFLPLVPGTQLVLEGRSNLSGLPVPHQVTLIVTDLFKTVNGVRSAVVWDVDRRQGQVIESELAFFAQDNGGNVWNMGEYPEEFQNGQFLGAPNTWISGLSGAKGGTAMLANPQIGNSYLQGSSPNIDFLDCGKVVNKGQTVCVPTGCYNSVLVVDETSPLDPDSGIQRKFYAPGVGTIKVEAVNDPEGETLVLISATALSPTALSNANTAALELDRRGYRNSSVYRETSPAQRRLH